MAKTKHAILHKLNRSKGLVASRGARHDEMRQVVDAFRSRLVPMSLSRIGGKGDGGYLVPYDLEGIAACFSPGVDVTAEFERELAERHGIRSYMADASVAQPPFSHPLFDFEPKFLGSRTEGVHITLSDWMSQKLGDDRTTDLILQMDIEGAEWDVLIQTPIERLRQFRIMVVEFHDLDILFNPAGLRMIRAVFDKLAEAFVIAHVHPNNVVPVRSWRGVSVPPLFEVTFLRADRVDHVARTDAVKLPHPLDETNVPHMPDFAMPPEWWRQTD